MNSVNKIRIDKLINNELESAMAKHGKIDSINDGYFVILSKFEELIDSKDCFAVFLNKLRESINKNYSKEKLLEIVDYLEYYSLDIIKEAIQIAAMIKRNKIDVLL